MYAYSELMLRNLVDRVAAIAHRMLHGKDVPMRFDVAVKNKTPVVERHVTTRTPDQYHRMVELVKRVEAMIAAEHFLPNEQGFYCAGCPFQEACRGWYRAGSRVRVTGKAA